MKEENKKIIAKKTLKDVLISLPITSTEIGHSFQKQCCIKVLQYINKKLLSSSGR